MSYKVLAPCVIARDRNGSSHHLYEGSIVDQLDAAQAKRWLDEGLVEEIGSVPAAADPALGPPQRVATKAEWVDYAVASCAGTDTPLSVEDAEAMTKAELVEQFGG